MKTPTQRHNEPQAHLNHVVAGSGTIVSEAGRLRLLNAATTTRTYSNAQIDDYQGLPRRRFRWRPPLTLTVQARFSEGQPPGTAGFGLWNEPFSRQLNRLPAPPQAVWFFYASPPSDMRLALDTPGRGWKAAVIDANRLSFWLLAPFAPLGILVMRLPPLYRILWPIAQRAIGVAEASLAVDKTDWRSYQIEWGVHSTNFSVDGETVLAEAPSPRGPLGLVMWMDNQYMTVTTQGRFRSGLLASRDTRWLELGNVVIETSTGFVQLVGG
ncbi:MAG: hypothetical protein J5I90_14445 [Caldilineales bacterium]|nr:hypothetical protein [Caldilineales bacterium]